MKGRKLDTDYNDVLTFKRKKKIDTILSSRVDTIGRTSLM